MVNFDTGASPYEVAAADLDADGKSDLIVAGSKSLSVFKNTTTQGAFSATSFAAKIDLVSDGLAINSVATGDIDGDGKTDIVATSTSAGVNTVTVFRNNCIPG